MRDKDEIIRELHTLYEEYDNTPSYHQHRPILLEKINILRWVLNMKPVQTNMGGGLML